MTTLTTSPGAKPLETRPDPVMQRALETRQKYADTQSQFSNFLIYGDFGTGKTRITTTCPRPVWIDSFDPGGTKTSALQPLIATGDIIVDNRWETDSWKTPWAFREWEREMFSRVREGFFTRVGTYVLDSITKWSDSMMFAILQAGTKGKSRAGQNPELQDYLVQQMTAIDWLSQMMAFPCHTIVTGHIGLMKDEVEGRMVTGLLLAGKLSDKVPLSFDEKYVTRGRETAAGMEYQLQTKNDGQYKAETRMGGDLFKQFETPDLRRLLKIAGRSSEDRPRLFTV